MTNPLRKQIDREQQRAVINRLTDKGLIRRPRRGTMKDLERRKRAEWLAAFEREVYRRRPDMQGRIPAADWDTAVYVSTIRDRHAEEFAEAYVIAVLNNRDEEE